MFKYTWPLLAALVLPGCPGDKNCESGDSACDSGEGEGEGEGEGQDCYQGYEATDGTVYLFCHPMSSSGVALSSVTSISAIDEGSTTIFSNSLEDVITYAAFSDSTGDCWTWGHDTSYYTADGCVSVD